MAVELAEEAGPAAGIHFSRDHGSSFALEIVGHYPDVGTVSQTAIIQGATTDTPRGSLTFAAETRDAAAFIEFNLAGDVVAEGGDAAVVNDQLAPVLTTSPTWKDAHTLTLALANTSDGVAEQPEAGLAVVLPVPNPRASGVKKSMVAMAMACGKSAVMCTLAATWLPPAITTCYGDSVACALTIGCAVVSCID